MSSFLIFLARRHEDKGLSWPVPLLVVVIGVIIVRFQQGKDAMLTHWVEAKLAARAIFIALSLYYLPVFSLSFVKTIYNDHMMLAGENTQLREKNKNLTTDLEWRKHNISTTDAVFPNLIYMLHAFDSFKRDMDGAPCALYVSAPKESAPLASVMVQLAGPVSGCAPMGPVSADNPELDEEVIDGMVPDAIVVHAIKGERAADNLFSTLGNQIQLKRSYRLFRNPKERWPVRFRTSNTWCGSSLGRP